MKDYVSDFTKCLQSVSYTKRSYEIFQDFLTASAISFANIIKKDKNLEQEYLKIIKQYEHPEKLAELLTITVLALEEKSRDFLGEVFMRCEFGNKNTSQFFTPYHISQMMPECVFDEDDIKETIQEKGFIKVSEPCCGSGGMILAFAETMLTHNINTQKYMIFQGIDIDITCCKMAFIQTSLMGLTGEIVHGDTISLKTWNNFITPMTILNLNNFKKFKEATKDTAIQKQEVIEHKTYEQLKII